MTLSHSIVSDTSNRAELDLSLQTMRKSLDTVSISPCAFRHHRQDLATYNAGEFCGEERTRLLCAHRVDTDLLRIITALRAFELMTSDQENTILSKLKTTRRNMLNLDGQYDSATILAQQTASPGRDSEYVLSLVSSAGRYFGFDIDETVEHQKLEMRAIPQQIAVGVPLVDLKGTLLRVILLAENRMVDVGLQLECQKLFAEYLLNNG